MRPVATPPDAAFVPFWARQAGLVLGVCGALLVAALVGQAAAGRPGLRLAAAVSDGSEAHAAAALGALRRMGPTAADTIPALVEARSQAPPATRDRVTRTLGYLGPDALGPLAEIAQGDDEAAAVVAVESL